MGSKKITGVDIVRPDRSVVPEAEMKYWNLENLAKAIHGHEILPGDIPEYQGIFDMIMLITPGVDRHVGDLLNYFLRIGGIACIHPSSILHTVQKDRSHWKHVPNTKYFVQKIG